MNILEYLSETEYAVKNLIDLISHDRKILNRYIEELTNLKMQLSPFEELYEDYI